MGIEVGCPVVEGWGIRMRKQRGLEQCTNGDVEDHARSDKRVVLGIQEAGGFTEFQSHPKGHILGQPLHQITLALLLHQTYKTSVLLPDKEQKSCVTYQDSL